MDWSSAKTSKSSKGLWIFSYDEHTFKYADSEVTIAHQATRITASTAVVLGCVALMFSPFHAIETVLGVPLEKKLHRFSALLTFSVALVTCGCCITAMIIWGLGVHDNDQYILGPGFVTCLVGGFFVLLGGMEANNATKEPPQSVNRHSHRRPTARSVLRPERKTGTF
ncbi:hypothetical protein RRG08_029020 [Elysia crispata]|uniref:Uncharacterized protein n=1 Tax=Elysia crispata TaxID=231223 RepID=A0AAE0ZJ57_9GAST|nr:hypothetical protein RRG08_029020 [Elysia crispata]